MKLSVFVVTVDRLELLALCCQSILVALPDEAEFIVVANGSSRAVLDWLDANPHPRMRVVKQESQHRSFTRNRAFDLAKGEIIYFFDDDIQVPAHLFRSVLASFDRNPRLAVVGGPNLTPPSSTFAEELFGAVMTSSFAAPRVSARYGSGGKRRKASELELILCNLAVKKSDIPPAIRFRGLRSNEENLFLFECSEADLEMEFDPDNYVFHARRVSLRLFAKQIFIYGAGRAEQTCLRPLSCHPFFLAPAAVIVLAFVEACNPLYYFTLFESVALYFTLALLGAVCSRDILNLGLRGVLYCVPLTALVHLAYGLGFWRGILGGLLKVVPKVYPPKIEALETSVRR